MSARRFWGRSNPARGLSTLFGIRRIAGCASEPGVAPEIGRQPNGKKVLVVDDDAVILKTTAMKLEAQGYKVVLAKDAPGAIRAARKERPDLILMDVSFPPDVAAILWDGFLIMSWLRRLEQTRDIP